MDEKAVKIVRQYEAGIVTDSECLWELIEAAAGGPPKQIIVALPAEWRSRLREAAAEPPESLDLCPRSIRGGIESDRRLWFDGIRRWHDYFGAAAPD